ASHFHVVLNNHISQLRELVVAPVGKDVTESVRAHHHAGVQHDAVANPRTGIDRDAWMEHAVIPHAGTPAHVHSRTKIRTCSNGRAALDHNVRPNAHFAG